MIWLRSRSGKAVRTTSPSPDFVDERKSMRRILYRVLTALDEFFKGRFHRLCDWRHSLESKYPELIDD